jgi:hypothetical protein
MVAWMIKRGNDSTDRVGPLYTRVLGVIAPLTGKRQIGQCISTSQYTRKDMLYGDW